MTALATGLVGSVRRHTMAACAIVVLGAAWWWQLAALQEARGLVWLAVTAFSVLTGFVALGWLRPARVGITAPQAMMLLGTLGMLAGSRSTSSAPASPRLRPCAPRTRRISSRWRGGHLERLPAMHVGMVAGGLGARLAWLRRVRPGCRRQFCARFVQNIACSGWMIVGMVAGVVLYYQLAAWLGAAGVPAMLGGMIGGMVWGMVVSVSIYRVYIGLRGSGAGSQR